MSSKKGKKSKLSSGEVESEKAKVVYERIKTAYGGISNEELGEMLGGISKQAIGQRIKSGNYDPQEIYDLLPGINYDWIFSDDLKELRTLPVRQKGVSKEAQNAISHIEGKGELSRGEVKELLGQIEGFVKILKDNL